MKILKALCVAATCLSAALAVNTHAAPAYRWQSVPWGGAGFVDGFVYHPHQQGLLYARTDIGGMYRWDGQSQTWTPLLDALGHDDADLMGVISMAVDPQDPQKLYAACGLYINQWARKGAILRSEDQGHTWLKTELPIGVGGNMDGRGTGERLVVDPKNGKTIYFGSNLDGLWRSVDGGASFTRLNDSVKAISLVAAQPDTQGVLFVGSADDKPGLYISSDGGASLVRVEAIPQQVPQHLAFATDGTLYVAFASGKTPREINPSNATGGSVWKRDRTGKWSEITPIRSEEGKGFGYSGVDVGPDGTLAVSTIDRWWPGDDIFISTDAGLHWIALSEKSRHNATGYPWLMSYTKGEDHMGHWIADLKINPLNSDEMIYGTGYGLWMSQDLAAVRSGHPVEFKFNVGNFEEAATTQLVSPLGGATVLATFLDVAGAAWDDLTAGPKTGLFQPLTEANYSVDYAGLRPDYVVRRASSDAVVGYASETGGADWAPITPLPENFKDGKAGWHRQSSIAVSAAGTSLVWGAENMAGYYSTDSGKTWKTSAGWPQGSDRPLPVVSDKAIDRVFYVYDRVGKAIDISVDGGASFKPVITGLPALETWQNGDIYVVPGRARDLWLVATFGLLHSARAGDPMTSIATVDTVWKLGFGAPAKTDGYPAIYLWGIVKGQEGLWRSDDEAKSWTRINDDMHQFGHIDALAGDPLEYGTVYIAPGGRGILVGRATK